MRQVLFCLLLFIVAGCVKKDIPTTGAIHGTVRDSETNQPLPGCAVMLMPTGTTATTGSDGSFHFEDLLPDTYSVEVSCYNYYTNKKSIIVGVNDGSMSVDILLTRFDPNNRLAELGALKVGGITFKSARVECEIIQEGSSTVTERGFLYSETPDVTIATATRQIVKTTENIFFATLDNLAEKTEYYVAAYATNGRGTAYSEVVKFTTGDASTVTAPTNVIYVSVSGNDANDGRSWGKAKRTLKAAMVLATDQDQVWASAGTLDDTLYLKNGVPVYGGFKGTETTTETRTEKTRIKVIIGVGLTDKTVANGFQIVRTGNAGSRLEGNVVLENCRFGEVDKSSYAQFRCKGENNELKGCIIERCKSGVYDAGGFIVEDGSLIMTDCIYRGNETYIQVGYYNSGTLKMYNCLVTNNADGGIHLKNYYGYNCIVELYNCTLANNSQRLLGTAYPEYAKITLYNCLLYNNKEIIQVAVQNSCILVETADNSRVKLKRPSTQRGYEATDWQTADWSIEAGSSCIDAGVSLYFPSDKIKTDLAGNDRISGTSIDVGAYEY